MSIQINGAGLPQFFHDNQITRIADSRNVSGQSNVSNQAELNLLIEQLKKEQALANSSLNQTPGAVELRVDNEALLTLGRSVSEAPAQIVQHLARGVTRGIEMVPPAVEGCIVGAATGALAGAFRGANFGPIVIPPSAGLGAVAGCLYGGGFVATVLGVNHLTDIVNKATGFSERVAQSVANAYREYRGLSN